MNREQRVGILIFLAAIVAIVVMLGPFSDGGLLDAGEVEVLDETLER